MICNDHWIRTHARGGMIVPFEPRQQRDEGRASFGTSSFGYDLRLGGSYKSLEDGSEWSAPTLVVHPQQTVLGVTLERVIMPPQALALCVGKSTHARKGIHVLTTPIEPEWEGYITLEIANLSSKPVTLYEGEGIAQLLFFCGERPTQTYAERDGRYQDQPAIPVGPK